MSLQKILLYCYPRAWRARYGEELLAMLEERPMTPADVLGTIGGALDAHLHPQFGTSGMVDADKLAHLVRSLRLSLLSLFCAYISFIIAGLAFWKLTEDRAFMLAASTHKLVGGAFTLVQFGSLVALGAILLGGFPILCAVVKDAVSRKRFGSLLLLSVPILAFFALRLSIAYLLILPQHAGRTGLFGLLLILAVSSTASVCIAVARSRIPSGLLRFAVLPSMLATVAMALMLSATILWGLGMQNEQPDLFMGYAGILRSSTAGTWLGISIAMTLVTIMALVSLLRSISARSALRAA